MCISVHFVRMKVSLSVHTACVIGLYSVYHMQLGNYLSKILPSSLTV